MPKRRWQVAEIEELLQRYWVEGPERLARELGRSMNAVTSQANRMGMQSLTRRERQAATRRRRQLSFASMSPDGLLDQVGWTPS
jgi:hypothetical protein